MIITTDSFIKGNEVTIKVKNNSCVSRQLFPNEPDTISYTGNIVGSAEFDPPESIRITGNIKMPVRVIMFRSIVELNGEPVDLEKVELIEKPRHVFVVGSTGKTYKITINDLGNYSCTCSGFGFRKTCSHIDKFKKENK